MMSEEIHEYLSKILLKDPMTCEHCSKAAKYAMSLGDQVCLKLDEMEALILAAVLHDLGKIKVPSEILLKPDSLTEEEYDVIKCHPAWGAEMIEFDAPGNPRRKMVADIVRHHHERYDGWGYPDGLKGERIPYLSQIVAIADAFDAMTSDRPYRKGMSANQARNILQSERGKQFHPVLVDKFLQAV
jgi:HD-GYP domain-containing protein (c-di-GMP phosphodiesterase class II)